MGKIFCHKKILLGIALLILFNHVNAQEFQLGNLFGKGNLFKLNGGINSSFIYNYTNDPRNQRDPFTMVLGGNLNLFVGGINVPMSFSYSNAKISAVPPMYFNQFSIHPTYKWATAHLGTSSLTYSPYTLNGHQFDGVGLDLTPGKLKFQIMTGRLLRGTGDYNENPEVPPVFKRKASSLSVHYQFSDKLMLGVTAFHAIDISSSAFNIPYEYNIQPKENFIASINGDYTIIENLKLKAEIASNYLTQDLNSSLPPNINKGLFGGFVNLNGSSKKQAAQKINLSYLWKTIDMGLEYEKVDLNYQSLGAYQTQNGFENSLIRLGSPIFKGKVNLSGSIGIQNDLTDTVSSQKAKRLISSLNATFTPINKLTINANYSNNNSVTNFRNLDQIANSNNLIPYYLDSLKLVLVNMNLGVNANYQIASTKTFRQSLTAGYTLQKGSKKQGEYFVDEEGNNFHNANAVLVTTYPQSTVQWTFGFNYNLSTQGLDSKTTAYGPSFSFGKKFLNKKLLANLGTAYNTSYNNISMKKVNVMNVKANLGYNIKQRHDFKLNVVLQTKSSSDGITQVTNNTMTGLFSVNYNYTF